MHGNIRWIQFATEMKSNNTNYHLTRKEQRILQLLADGNNFDSICDHLMINDKTLHIHLKRLVVKFEVKTVSEAVVVGVREKLVTSIFIASCDSG